MKSSQEEAPFKSAAPELKPIHHKQSPRKVLLLRVYFFIITVMVISAIVYNLVVALERHLPVLILAVVNMILSSLVGLLLVYWYRNEDLSDNKLWYLVFFGILICFQCLTADIFVGHAEAEGTHQHPTRPPHSVNVTELPTNGTTKHPKISVQLSMPEIFDQKQ